MDTREVAAAITVALINKPDVTVPQLGAKTVATFFRQLVKYLDEPLKDGSLSAEDPNLATARRARGRPRKT